MAPSVTPRRKCNTASRATPKWSAVAGVTQEVRTTLHILAPQGSNEFKTGIIESKHLVEYQSGGANGCEKIKHKGRKLFKQSSKDLDMKCIFVALLKFV